MRPLTPAAVEGLVLIGIAVLVAVLALFLPLSHTPRPVPEGEPPPETAVEVEERSTEVEDEASEPPPRPDVLAGRVRLPAGVPAKVVEVRVSADVGPDRPAFRQILEVSPTGAWRIEGLAEGTYGVSVSFRWRGRRYHGAARADAGENAVEVPLRVEDPTPREILVRVLDSSGQPIRSGWVAVHPPARPDAQSPAQVEQGSAVVEILEGYGPLWFEAWSAPGELGGSVVLGPVADFDEVFEIPLGEPRTIEGRILASNDGAAPGFRVTARVLGNTGKPWHIHAATTTDEGGRFVLRGLGNHVYEVSAERPEDGWDLQPLLLRGGATDITFRLRTEAPVVITVVDVHGEPVEGAFVSLFDKSLPENRVCFARTDASGVARLKEVDLDVRYTLTVQRLSRDADLGSLVIEDWKPKSMTLRLNR